LHRPTQNTTPAVCCLLFLFFSVTTASAQVVNLGGARQKITTASNVRVRAAPETSADEVTRLRLGTVVSADARSAEQMELGGKKDYWYRVALPGDYQGWVFGPLLTDYDPARRDEVVQRIVEERLNVENMSSDDTLDLYGFVERSLAGARGASKGELERARLHALGRALGALGEDGKGRLPNADFQKAHEHEIYHHEFAGAWAVKPEAFWELETKHHGTPLGDRIAWDAANALRQGECEGDEVCNFLAFQDTQGRYLGLYPTGAHAAEALQNLKEALASSEIEASLKSKGGDEYAQQEREALKKALADLRAAVSKADGPDKAAILQRLEQLTPRGAK
jgi:hypothetical protein